MKFCLPLCFIFCIASCSSIPDVAKGEILLAQPPSGWQSSYSLINDATRLTDFVPDSESTEKLSFESHKSLVEVDPITIVMGELDRQSEICENIQSYNLFSGLENDYPTSVRLTFCAENAHSGQGEVTITKAIQGNEYLYIIKFVRTEAPFTNDETTFTKPLIAAWSKYFGDIQVCDRSMPNHPCPTDSP